MAIRFVQVFDADTEPRRMAEVQRIFRSYFGVYYGDYADRIPDLLRRQAELGQRTILITAENPQHGRVFAFALAFHYTDLNATLLDFIVVDPTVRQRGIGGALYEALREYLVALGSRGLYLEVRPDAQELEPDAVRRRENRARIRFYERYGARVIQGTTYEAKRPERTEGEPYVMFDSLGGAREPSAAEVRGMMSATSSGSTAIRGTTRMHVRSWRRCGTAVSRCSRHACAGPRRSRRRGTALRVHSRCW